MIISQATGARHPERVKTISHLHGQFNLPEWREWIDALPARVAELPATHLLQGGRNRVCWAEHQGEKFVIKHFRNAGPWKKMVYRISTSKARRSFDHSMALIDAGVPSPQPVGWREDWSGGFLRESFYVCAMVEIAHSARAIRRNREIDWAPQIEKIARNTARMHDAGILHLDLTAGNILFVGESPEAWVVHLIDNNRMTFGRIGLRRGIQSLLQLMIEGERQERYVTTYAHAREFDPEVCLSVYQGLIGRHKLKWRIKNITRPWRRKIGL